MNYLLHFLGFHLDCDHIYDCWLRFLLFWLDSERFCDLLWLVQCKGRSLLGCWTWDEFGMKDERAKDDIWPEYDFKMFERQTWMPLEHNCIRNCNKSMENHRHFFRCWEVSLASGQIVAYAFLLKYFDIKHTCFIL